VVAGAVQAFADEAKVVNLRFSNDDSVLAYATADVSNVWRTSNWSEVSRVRDDR